MYDTTWVNDEFREAPIRDKRLGKRLISTAKRLAEFSHFSIPQACGNLANAIGAYRFFDNNNVNPDAILSSHRDKTIERINNYSTILNLQDTTYLECQGLNPGEKLLLHSSLAVTTEGVPLGLLSQDYWVRKPKDPTRKHKELGIENKESSKWLTALDKSLQNIPSNIHVVTVCDREADIYDFFHKAITENRDLLIRAAQDRYIANGNSKKLVAQVENMPSAGEVIATIPRNANLNSPEREARLSIKFCPVSIEPPKKRSKAEKLPNLNLYAILVEEKSVPPKGVKSIYWLLLTTLTIDTAEQAFEKVLWYKQRWKIERFHFVLKSGCTVEEIQLETIERFTNATALYSVIAWRILWMTYESRENPDTPCDKILEKHEWQALYCFVHKTKKLPDKAPTMSEAILLIAKLGGFLNRKRDGQPGVAVIWRGMSRLADISQTWLIANSQ